MHRDQEILSLAAATSSGHVESVFCIEISEMQDSHCESVRPIALFNASAMPLIANFDAPNATFRPAAASRGVPRWTRSR